MTKILLADDHPVVIMGVKNILDKSSLYQVIGQAGNAAELIQMTRELVPDIVITDYNMPGDERYPDGLALVQFLCRNFPRIHVLIHTMITSPVIVSGLYEEGVSGVVFKNDDLTEILAALEAIRGNRVYHAAPKRVSITGRAGDDDAAARISRLSLKELEVLRHFLSGKTVSDIANIMNRSVKTISTHKIAAMRKLEVETDHELVMFGVNHELFS